MRTHDEAVGLVQALVADISREEVARSFAASLSARRLDWRSALGSWAAMQHLPTHDFAPSRYYQGRFCAVCELPEHGVGAGGPGFEALRANQKSLVRFYDTAYALADLATFRALAAREPTAEDRRMLAAVLDGLRALGPEARLGQLDAAIRKIFPSNKNQRKYVLEAFAIAGILRTPDVPSYEVQWVDADAREGELQTAHFYARDSAYPLQHWRGDGVDEAAIERWFGFLLR
ncbi:MAG: hypothetical protein EP330_06410 [Deltaproteobacteria bacterium]|nr:MAG: hypothetical protein EP330_06410 [Deltaproteobacteria bacterium]